MTSADGLESFRARLKEENISVQSMDHTGMSCTAYGSIAVEQWGTLAKVASEAGLRWDGIWCDEFNEAFKVYASVSCAKGCLIFSTHIPKPLTDEQCKAQLPSHTPYFSVASRMERHMRDMFGIDFIDHPDSRRWTRHQAWQDDDHPLRDQFPLKGKLTQRTPADSTYPFSIVQGNGVYQIPVGPVHAGIIEPGHFRFHAIGENILNLEERLGYTHKGIEKNAQGRDVFGLARLAGRVSGDSTVAHTWAACMAMESALNVTVPTYALVVRAILAERERIANHLGDIGGICNDVGFAFMQMQFSRLRETWQRGNATAFGHRLLMDCIVPGGVAGEISPDAIKTMQAEIEPLTKSLDALIPIIDDDPSLVDRLATTGYLAPEYARELGVRGYVGKASDLDFDLRRDQPYSPYDTFKVTSPVCKEGDVAARIQIRMEETHASLELLHRLYSSLHAGDIQEPIPECTASCEGVGRVEGWRGDILTFVRLTDQGNIARFFPRDPSWFLFPALEQALKDQIVPDFPVCNKSINASYSGHDL